MILTTWCWVAAGQQFPPLSRANFTLSGTQGFGFRHNTWPWSTEWFNGRLLVGTFPWAACVHSIGIGGYPPADPAISCPPDPKSLGLQAEIWSWMPASNEWTRVFQSPQDLLIPGATNQFVARDIGFRGMSVFTESDGTQALYVSGCSSKTLYPGGLPGARLLRSTDGVTFTPVPQQPGTFLGNIGNPCFRGSVTHNGKFYIVPTASLNSEGVLLEATNPELGNNAFRVVSPPNAIVSEVASFNGFLYITTANATGFSVLKSAATGPLPYMFTPVIVNAGYSISPTPNVRALSLHEFNGDLYVGGLSNSFYQGGSELLRIHPDDSWDLIVGQSRMTPVGMKSALSGWKPGFNWAFNTSFERMEVFDGRLYLGTFDSSNSFHAYNNPTFQALVRPQMGFDLWVTTDGVTFSRVDGQGFGDLFNQGVRTLKATPHGLFLGAANWFYGLQVWRGVP
jgi:hypothetical protein